MIFQSFTPYRNSQPISHSEEYQQLTDVSIIREIPLVCQVFSQEIPAPIVVIILRAFKKIRQRYSIDTNLGVHFTARR